MNTASLALKPYWYITPSFQAIIKGIFLALVPQIALLFLTQSYSALFVIFVATAASMLAELADFRIRKIGKFSGMISCVQGLITGMFLPSTYPLFSVFCVTFITMLLIKQAFTGVANSWINAAALVVALAYIAGARYFPDFRITKSMLSERFPSFLLLRNGNTAIALADSAITDFLNLSLLRVTGASVPAGYVSLFWDSGSIIPAFRFNVLTLVSSLALISLNMIHWLVPFCYLTCYLVCVALFGSFFFGGNFGQGDILLATLTGGTLFSAFFLLDWFGTAPLSLWGKTLYGSFAGIAAFLISGYGTSPAGAVITVLSANLASVIIQFVEQNRSRTKLQTKLLPQLVDLLDKKISVSDISSRWSSDEK